MRGMRGHFWGKLRRDSQGLVSAWLSLEDHCCDVGACCEAVLNHSLLRQRFSCLGRNFEIGPIQIARLSALAAFHDLGKFNLGFQAKADLNSSFSAGHVNEILSLCDGSLNYSETISLSDALECENIERWGEDEAGFRLLIASFAHHGKPGAVGTGHRSDIWQPRNGLDPFTGIRNLVDLAKTWFPEAFTTTGTPFPDSSAFHHAFNGLVTLADWLGSDERFFPFTRPAGEDRITFSRRQAAKALPWIGLDVLAARLSLGTNVPGFDRVSGFMPRPAQSCLQEIPLSRDGSLAILEAETGAGKTEAALMRFLLLFHAGLVDGMYFGLPTRTSATQMFGRVRASIERAFPETDRRPNVILAVPGYIAVDDRQGKALPDFEVLWDDDPNGRWWRRGWAAESPKRYLAGTVVVGTIDQILLAGLMVPHAHLRMTMLLRQFLVIDEVHASDAYMNRILETVIRLHLKAGGHALLMSATLGCETRERFLSLSGSLTIPSFAEACRIPFPNVTAQSRGASLRVSPIEAPMVSKKVEVRFFPIAADYDALGNQALAFAEQGARVLVLRNTVSDCVKTQLTVERHANETGLKTALFHCGMTPTPHHSRYCKEDREILDSALEKCFGPGSQANGVVLVATQTVQQSLDLDFDIILTDLCPMDILLQRVGRVHRHQREDRPEPFRTATLGILVPARRDLGSLIWKTGETRGPNGIGTVYTDLRILEATWRTLEEFGCLTIPAMNRVLVERTTHPQALAAIVQELGGAWAAHDMHLKGVLTAQRGVATINHVKWDAKFGEPDSLFPSKELNRQIQTRLGAGDRLIRFETPFLSPFAATVRCLTLPTFMVRNAEKDAEPQEIVTDPLGTDFSFGAARYRYDRLGLRFADAALTIRESEEDSDA